MDIGEVEKALYKLALDGNLQAIKYFLEHMHPDVWGSGAGDEPAPAVVINYDYSE